MKASNLVIGKTYNYKGNFNEGKVIYKGVLPKYSLFEGQYNFDGVSGIPGCICTDDQLSEISEVSKVFSYTYYPNEDIGVVEEVEIPADVLTHLITFFTEFSKGNLSVLYNTPMHVGLCYASARYIKKHCDEVDAMFDTYAMVSNLSLGWSKRTTTHSYPIHTDTLIKSNWEGKQLELRQELAGYIAAKLMLIRGDVAPVAPIAPKKHSDNTKVKMSKAQVQRGIKRRKEASEYVRKHFIIDVKPTIRQCKEIRQFSREFKQACVRVALAGPLGTTTVLVNLFNLSTSQLPYWIKQQKAGHFDINRAIAFSRQP